MSTDSHGQIADTSLFDAETFKQQLSESSQPIPLLKNTLKTTQEELDKRFKDGIDIRTLIYGRAWIVDEVLEAIWNRFTWPEDNQVELIAVGGYGRGELHPYSDVDLLILFNGCTPESCHDSLSSFLTLLWDIGLDIGSSVRTLEECCEEARNDVTIATNLIESRTLVGSGKIHARMYEEVTSEGAWTDKEFFRAKLDEQKARHKKTNDTEYNLEPNLKTSPGGLRDLQTIGWVAKRHFGTTYIRDLVSDGFLTDNELESLNQGELYLWTIRYALHMTCGRHEDRLLFDHQRTLAALLNYQDSDNGLAVEQFMSQYYRVVKSMSEFNHVLLQHFDEAILRGDEIQEIVPFNSRFHLHDDLLEASHASVFKKSPCALLEVFVILAQNEHIKGLRASTIRLIRDNRHLINDQFREDIRNTSLFMELMKSPEGISTELKRMNRLGILGRYLPEFGKIVGQMQHDLFHIYTVDAHTLKLIQITRQFRHKNMQEQFPLAYRIVNTLPKIELLYIAALFHDIGKGRGGDHSELGAVDVVKFCERHQLGEWDTQLIEWLVRNHLLMSMTSQRKDISDPDVIHKFATQVGDQLHLDYLYALTVADINATNHTLWNNWRATLMRNLYQETQNALRRGLHNPLNVDEFITQQQQDALALLQRTGIDQQLILDFWSSLGDEYFIRETPRSISWHTRAILEHGDNPDPLVMIRQTSDRTYEGATEIFVYTKDIDKLFAASVAILDQINLNIQDARIIASANGFTLNTYTVLTTDYQALSEDPSYLKDITVRLVEGLDDPEDYPEIIDRRIPRQLKLFSTPTRVTISTDPTRGETILEVITPDRPGLLARMGQIFVENKVSICKARITSIGERVEDFFYITDEHSNPIADPALCERLQKEICEQLDQYQQ